MEQAYAVARKRTCRAVAEVSLESVGCSNIHEKSFEAYRNVGKHQVVLVHMDLKKRLCLFTNASDLLWAGVISQTLYGDLSLLIGGQRNAPLAFIPRHFRDAKICWATIEKEGYAIMATVQRMYWLLAAECGFDLFTDLNNLIFHYGRHSRSLADYSP